MIKRKISLISTLSLLSLVAMLSLSVKASAIEVELSQVTIFVEGMMKSVGGVT